MGRVASATTPYSYPQPARGAAAFADVGGGGSAFYHQSDPVSSRCGVTRPRGALSLLHLQGP